MSSTTKERSKYDLDATLYVAEANSSYGELVRLLGRAGIRVNLIDGEIDGCEGDVVLSMGRETVVGYSAIEEFTHQSR